MHPLNTDPIISMDDRVEFMFVSPFTLTSREQHVELKSEITEILTSTAKEADKSEQIERLLKGVTMKFSGPLPHPELLSDYERCCPGIAERIVKMAEKEQEHRHYSENKLFDISKRKVDSEERRAAKGQWMGLIIVLIVFSAATYLIKCGYDVAGTILGSVDLIALVGIFVLGKLLKSNSNQLMSSSGKDIKT